MDTTADTGKKRPSTDPQGSNRLVRARHLERSDQSNTKGDWNSSSRALDFLQQQQDEFRSDEVSDDEDFLRGIGKLEKRLDKAKITTLSDLHDGFQGSGRDTTVSMLTLCGFDYQTIETAIAPMFSSAEALLDGRILSLQSTLTGKTGNDTGIEKEIDDAIKIYKAEATVFEGPLLSDLSVPRTNDIFLVLGPSGSGKTLFSLKGFPNPKDTTKSVTVYLKASEMPKSNCDSADALMSYVKETLAKRLENASSPFINRKLNMGVSLVIDEASALGDWIKEYQSLKQIYEVVSAVATRPRLILAGTGIDEITKGLGSDIQVQKYRMRPWGQKQMTAILRSVNNRNKIMAMIEREPLYRRLASNARAASYLIQELDERSNWTGDFKYYVNGVLQAVARKYIQSNGLGKLTSGERRLVAREVYRAVNEASDRVGEAYFPQWTLSLPANNEMKSCFLGLLNINVESAKGNPILLPGYEFSVSVTAAITIVLLAMLDVIGSLGHTWSDFEVICSINELQELVVNMEENVLVNDGVKILFLRQPFPQTRAKTKFEVPAMFCNEVFVNGERAPFADVIAPYCVCQCKYVSDPTKDVVLELDEFVKMGILEPDGSDGVVQDKILLHGALLSALAGEWESKQSFSTDDPDSISSSTSSDRQKGLSRNSYLASQLVIETTVDQSQSTRQFAYNKDTTELQLVPSVSGNEVKYKVSHELSEVVKVIFYTRGNHFVIKNNKATVEVTPEDVPRDGSIKSGKLNEIVDVLGMRLRKNVKLHFLFIRNHDPDQAWANNG